MSLSRIVELAQGAAPVISRYGGNNPRQLMNGLHAAGLIKHGNDRAGLAQLMQVLPGAFPRSPMPDDNEIESWAGYMVNALPELLQIGPTAAIGSDGSLRASRDGDDYNGHTWYALGEESTAAPVALTSDTLSVTDIGGVYRDAVLFVNTDAGKVKKLTAVTVDEEPLFLGTGGFVDAPLVDIELLGQGPAVGLYLGDIEDEITITYQVAPSSSDVIARFSIYAACRSKSNSRRPIMPSSLRRTLSPFTGR